MSNAERRLAEAFAVDMPPATDHAFTFAVLERIERRRAWTDVMEMVPYIIAAATLLWILAPFIEDLVEKSWAVIHAPNFLAAIILALSAIAIVGIGRASEALL
jgi:hypothetical protein